MQKNILKSGIEISELGLGCMSLGTEYANVNLSLKKQSKVVSLILILPIFMIEGLMKNCGQSFKKYQNRDDIVIGTKVGNRPTGRWRYNMGSF